MPVSAVFEHLLTVKQLLVLLGNDHSPCVQGQVVRWKTKDTKNAVIVDLGLLI